MRGDIIYKILDFLEDRSAGLIDLVETFLENGYGASITKTDYQYNLKQAERWTERIKREKIKNLRDYISKLKTDGLVLKNSSEKISLSPKGKKKLRFLKRRKILDKNLYQEKKGKEVIIVSYDLPVLFNRERDRLREVLKVLGFKKIHKSVWVGKIKLPEQFILGLEKLGILKYVEILKVTKTGSLKSL